MVDGYLYCVHVETCTAHTLDLGGWLHLIAQNIYSQKELGPLVYIFRGRGTEAVVCSPPPQSVTVEGLARR